MANIENIYRIYKGEYTPHLGLPLFVLSVVQNGASCVVEIFRLIQIFELDEKTASTLKVSRISGIHGKINDHPYGSLEEFVNKYVYPNMVNLEFFYKVVFPVWQHFDVAHKYSRALRFKPSPVLDLWSLEEPDYGFVEFIKSKTKNDNLRHELSNILPLVIWESY